MLIVTIKNTFSTIPEYITNILSEHKHREKINYLSRTYNIPKNIIISMTIMLSDYYSYIKKADILNYHLSKNFRQSQDFKNTIESVYLESMSIVSLIENDSFFDQFKTTGLNDETFFNLEAFILMTKTLSYESQIFDCLSCDINPKCNLFNTKIIKNIEFNDYDIKTLRHNNCPYSNMECFYEQLENNQNSLLSKISNKEIEKSISNMRDMIRLVTKNNKIDKNVSTQNLGCFQKEIQNLLTKLKKDKNSLYIFLKTIGDNIVKTNFGKHYINSENNPERTKEQPIQTIEDITKLSPKDLSELSYNQDEFFKKILNQEYDVKKNQSSITGGIFILLDVSGSMGAKANHPTFMTSSTGAIASAFINVFTERCNNTNEPIYFRTFDTGTSPLQIIKTDKERDVFSKKIFKLSYNGGGTNIIQAMTTCLNDFKQSKVDPKKSELLLISDLEGDFPKESLQIIHDMHKMGTKVRIMRITTGYYPDEESSKNLQSVSDVFVEIDTSKPIKNDIFNIVKPLKKDNDE